MNDFDNTDLNFVRTPSPRVEVENERLRQQLRVIRDRDDSCSGNCQQGKTCDCAPAPAEASTEIGADDVDRDGLGVFRGLLAALPLAAVIFAIAAFAVWAR